MDIAIRGEGELVIRYVDKSGATLLQERLTVTGSRKTEALHRIALSLRTVEGDVDIAPVLVRQSGEAQRVRFDGEAPARFTRRRCKEIGCSAPVIEDALRGVAPAPRVAGRTSMSDDETALAKLVETMAQGRGR